MPVAAEPRIEIDGTAFTLTELDAHIDELQSKLSVLQAARQELASTSADAPLVRMSTRTTLSGETIFEDAYLGSGSVLSARHATIGKKLGSGFFGDVYQGEWRGIPVALKFVSPEGAEELMRESATLDALEHPNVMRLYGVIRREDPGQTEHPTGWPANLSPPCIVCELAAGGTFLGFLKRQSQAEQYDLAYWTSMMGKLVGAASGLAYLHHADLMHRDLKADNLLLSATGELKIADFGLAKARDARLKQTSSVGTFSHMAPEVMRGRYDLSADVFSFGIVLTEVLIAEEAQEIIDQTRTSEFGLSLPKLKAFLDDLLHPGACFRLADIAAECCSLVPVERPTAEALLGTLQQLKEEIDDVAVLEAAGFERSHAESLADRRRTESSCDDPRERSSVSNPPPPSADAEAGAHLAEPQGSAHAPTPDERSSSASSPSPRIAAGAKLIVSIKSRHRFNGHASHEARFSTVEDFERSRTLRKQKLGRQAVEDRQAEVIQRRQDLLAQKAEPGDVDDVRSAWGEKMLENMLVERAAQIAQTDTLMERSDGVGVFGMDKELEAKARLKYDRTLEAELRAWMQGLLGRELAETDLPAALHSGVVLCDLANAIRPGTVARVRRAEGKTEKSFHFIENVGNFLTGCQLIGVDKVDLFEVNDLINHKNDSQVLHTLTALRRTHDRLTGNTILSPKKKVSINFAAVNALGSFSLTPRNPSSSLSTEQSSSEQLKGASPQASTDRLG